MGIKQNISNWRTRQILEREERKAEKQEEKLYIRAKVREAKESRRQSALEVKARNIANRPSFTENISTSIKGLGSSGGGKKKGKGGFDLGGLEVGSNFDLGVGTGLDLGFGSSRPRKGKKRRNDNFGGFI